MNIRIEFCVEWDYTPKAVSLAAALVSGLKQPVGKGHAISEITLIPSGGGCFEVSVDGELIHSKRATGQKADEAQVVERVRQMLA